MAELRTTQFFAANVLTVNPVKTTAYTVPTGRRIIVRSIAARNLNGSTGQTFYVLVAGVLVFSYVLGAGSLSTGSYEWRPWLVLDEGDSLQLAVSNASGVGFVVGGSSYFI